MEIIFILILTHIIMKAAGQAGADQARTEVRRAGDAIRRDLGARRSEAAGRLTKRLDAGRAAGPVYPAWWAWAALRGAGALRRAFRQSRRPAETGGPRPLRATTGPFGRIWGAAWRGGAYAWGQARAQRAATTGQGQTRPEPVPVGVCERCGAVVAVAALADATTRHGRTAKMCAQCRADVAGERQGDADSGRPQTEPVPPDDVVDADVVDDVPELNVWDEDTGNWSGGTDQTGPPPVTPPVTPGVQCIECGALLTGMVCANPECRLCPGYRDRRGLPVAANPQQWVLPVRYCLNGCQRQLMPGTWHADSATNADLCLWCAQDRPDGTTRPREPVELAAIGDPIDANGNRMALAPEDRAQLAAEAARIAITASQGATAPDDSPPDEPAGATGSAAPAALPAPSPTGEDEDMTCGNPDGEVHTQADWSSQSGAITGQMGDISASAENALRCLNAKEAGREHVTLTAQWADQVASVMTHGQEVIEAVNARQDPIVNAVQGAGGSEEVAVPSFYDEM